MQRHDVTSGGNQLSANIQTSIIQAVLYVVVCVVLALITSIDNLMVVIMCTIISNKLATISEGCGEGVKMMLET